jgi:hypothetical protein
MCSSTNRFPGSSSRSGGELYLSPGGSVYGERVSDGTAGRRNLWLIEYPPSDIAEKVSGIHLLP